MSDFWISQTVQILSKLKRVICRSVEFYVDRELLACYTSLLFVKWKQNNKYDISSKTNFELLRVWISVCRCYFQFINIRDEYIILVCWDMNEFGFLGSWLCFRLAKLRVLSASFNLSWLSSPCQILNSCMWTPSPELWRIVFAEASGSLDH